MHCSIIIVGLVSLGCTITANPFNGKPRIAKRVGATVTATFDGCTAICWDASSTIQCEAVQCQQLQIPTPTPKPVLKARAATTSASEELWPTDSHDCKEFCGPFEGDDEIEACLLVCSESSDLPEANLTNSADMLEARANNQARHASEARLAGKFGLVPRDVTVTVTSFPASCTVGSAIQQASVALSEASAAIAQVVGVTAVAPVLPPAASAALSEASAFLSSIAASPIAPLPVFANATIVPGPSAPSVAPVTASNPAVATSPIQTATSSISKGAAAEGISREGIHLFYLTNVLTHVAFVFVAFLI